MTSTLPKGTLGSVASLLASTLYQGNPDRNHKLNNIFVLNNKPIITLSIKIAIFIRFKYKLWRNSCKIQNVNPVFATRITRREQELFTLLEQLRFSQVF
jgi:hypothetical protein